ncbi:MAG: ATP-binding protein, partial [Bacteroidota bacterium]
AYEGVHESAQLLEVDKQTPFQKKLDVPMHTNSFPIGVARDNSLILIHADSYSSISTSGKRTQADLPKGLNNISFFNQNSHYSVRAGLSYDREQDRFLFCADGRVTSFFRNQGGNQPYISAQFNQLDVGYFLNAAFYDDVLWLGSYYGLVKVQLKTSPFRRIAYKDPRFHAAKDFNSVRLICDYVDLEVKAGANDCHMIWGENSWEDSRVICSGTNCREGVEGIWRTHNDFWTWYKDGNGMIWASDVSGLFYVDPQTNRAVKWEQSDKIGQSFKNRGYQFYVDRAQQVWIVSANGLYRFDPQVGLTERYCSSDPERYMPTNELRHMYQDADGIYWIGSKVGLIKWDRQKATIRTYTTKDGLPNDHVMAVYEDDLGFLWLSTDNGIVQFEKSSGRARVYSTEDGITHREFNRAAHAMDAKGNIYFGGLNGITQFHPKDFAELFHQQPETPLLLTDCRSINNANNQPDDKMPVWLEQGKIVMQPGDRNLQLKFALLDYINNNPNVIQYAYKLEDEPNWNVGSESVINFNSLPYGQQLLSVRARKGDGLFSKQTLSIPIVVLKPFYLQEWFMILVAVLLIALVVVMQKIKTKRLLRRQQQLESTVAERTKTIAAQAAQLRKLDKAKSRFLANISHEFRTPLTLILNTLEEDQLSKIIDEQTVTEGQYFAKAEIDIMQRNTRRLQTLIDQLLDLSKLEAEQMTLQAAPHDFHQYLRELVYSFQSLAQNKGVQLQFRSFHAATNPEADASLLYFDREHMDKIVYNLLSNAIKFTPNNGSVIVCLQQQGPMLLLEVKDTGIGIPAEELPHIFDRFYQVKRIDAYAYEGTGLGLALVRELTELHGGKVEVKSEVGQGTQFKLYFRTGSDHLQTNQLHVGQQNIKNKLVQIASSQAVTAFAKSDHNEEKPLLLIIEDNADLRYHQQKKFSGDYQLLLAKDGEEGLALAFAKIPDLIVCDVMMPQKDGYEVCNILKQDERTNHIPILLLTAKASQEEKLEGLSAGADDYLIKPYDQRELRIRLQNLLSHSMRIREQQGNNIQRLLERKTSVTEQALAEENGLAKEAALQNPFLARIYQTIEANHADPYFGVESLAASVRLSRSQLFRKLKALTNDTPTNLIRSYRLAKAKALLEDFAGNASEVSYMVGFNNPSYFHKCFKAEFGQTPKEMMQMPKGQK